MTKAGTSTTEFWMSIAIVLTATVLTAIGKLDSNSWGMIVGGLAGVYTMGRSLAKTKPDGGTQ